ncbi:MAG: sodium:proton antiporter [Calditrichia bacterium]
MKRRQVKALITLIFMLSILFGFQQLLAQDHSDLQTKAESKVVAHDTTALTAGEHSGEEAHAEPSHGADSLGAELPLWSVIPFAGILLSIAIFPLVAPHFWHHNFGKVSLFWALLFAIPFVWVYHGHAIHEILHIYLLDYIPFIILLWSLFTVAGGILLEGTLVGTPISNLIMLLIGTILASWIGTTGAAMLLIRPIIRMNKYRKNKLFIVIFFIFLVANIGGSLTPLGDPPLFLGFLHGVPFFWTFHIFPEMLFVVVILFIIYFFIDSYFYRKEGYHANVAEFAIADDEKNGDSIILKEKVRFVNDRLNLQQIKRGKLRVRGLHNFLLLLGVILGVLFSGTVKLGEVNVLGTHMQIQNILRDIWLIFLGLLSLKTTKQEIREGNEFGWFPIVEVAKLFAGIFMTIIPALAILKAGEHGALKWLIDAVKEPYHFFWVTGTLSSFLDNAPTYLTFFNTALGRFSPGLPEAVGVAKLISDPHQIEYLKAIASGAVFFGAMTYIGNAPNFMVKSIAEENKIEMPSFFGYMLWSLGILGPIFILVTLVFF